MSKHKKTLSQPVGFSLESWQPCQHPKGMGMKGRRCRLEPLGRDGHTEDLFEAYAIDTEGKNWTYLPYGPFPTLPKFQSWIGDHCLGSDPCFYAVIDQKTGKAVGLASFLRIKPAVGVIEVGHIHFSPLMQGRAISTEAMYLMMKLVFDDLGYRRYEWKRDALNTHSCNAAKRLGFEFEGIFHQATIYKQRNRDTAWYAVLDRKWPLIKQAFEAWLRHDNFDAEGKQNSSLSETMRIAIDR